MVTNYPQQLTATPKIDTHRVESLMTRAVASMSQFLCGLRGHDSVLHFESNKVQMRCTSCGHDSPGWEITGHGPRRRFDGDARRHALVPHRLVLRKTA